MTDRDEWADRARPDDSPARGPQARRVPGSEAERWGDEEPVNAAPPRKGGGWVIPVVIAGVLLVGAVGAAVYLVVDGQDPPRQPPPVGFDPGPFGPGPFGPGQFGPVAPQPDWQPADEETARQVRAAFRKLGRALQKPDFDPDDHFDTAGMASTATDDVPRQTRWGQAVHDQIDGPPGGPQLALNPNAVPPLDPKVNLRTTLRNARPLWRKREWEKADVRSVIRLNSGPTDTVHAMVWQAQPDGPPVRWLWTFAPAGVPGGFGPGGPGGPPGAEPEDGAAGLKICQWEDLDSGLRGTDELALDLIMTAERRWDLYGFRQLADLHRQIENGEFEPAEERLARLARTRPVGRFADLCDLADARLRQRRGDSAGAVALLNPLTERDPQMVALFPLLCETHVLHGEPAKAVTDCRTYLKNYGKNPDIQAILADALRVTGEPDEAGRLLAAVFAERPDHPRALDVLRKMPAAADAQDGGEFARRVIESPKFFDLHKRLMFDRFRDDSRTSLRPLAEEYYARRPDDLTAVESLIQARAESGDTDAALELYLRYAPQVQRFERWRLTNAVTAAARTAEQRKALYARLPDERRDEFFPRLAQQAEYGGGGEAETRKELAGLVAVHAARRPNDPVVRLYQAKELTRDKKWAEAEATLAGIDVEQEVVGIPVAIGRQVQAVRNDVSYALKKWDAALAGKQGAQTFGTLAHRCENEKKWADLTALVAAAKKADAKLPPGAAEYWSGVALAGDGKHAAAAAEFQKALAAPSRTPVPDPDDEDDEYDGSFPRGLVVPQLARSLIRVGKAADALALLEKEEFVQPALYAHALTADGQAERAAKYLIGAAEGNRFFADGFYSDPDFGPLLLDKPEFADFRARHPKPPEPEKDD